MVNYKNGKIYKLWSPEGDMIYIGSTCRGLAHRKAQHKDKPNTTSKILFDTYTDIRIELIEEYPCDNKEQLNRKEGEYIRTLDCVNRCVAGRTEKEWREDNKEHLEEYREENKEHHAEKNREYYQKNKGHVQEKHKEYRENNKGHLQEKQKEYCEKNKERIAEKKKEWWEENKERLAEKKKEYREKNKEHIAQQNREYREKNKEHIAQQNREYRERKRLEKVSIST